LRRNIRSRRGQPKKVMPLTEYHHKSIGCIPMKITKSGKIVYKQIVPKNYSTREVNGEVECFDSESDERKNSILSTGEGSFIRRHVYEIRFNIRTDESDDERRKREYKEWIENEEVFEVI